MKSDFNYEKWEKTRKMGMFLFVFYYGFLIYGILGGFAFLCLQVAITLFSGGDWFQLVENMGAFIFLIWSVGGVLLGVFFWTSNEKKWKSIEDWNPKL